MRSSRPHRRTTEELLAATPTDPAAFAEFYDRHERTVFVFLARRTRRADLAADLTAEVFAAALEGAEGFVARDGAPATAWLFGIAHNVLAGSFRRARVSDDARRRLALPRLELADDTFERLERIVAAEAGRPALAFLDDLPPDQRAAVRAHVIEERDYAEIAAALDCSTAVVRQRVSRGLSTLRKQVSSL